MVYKGKYFLLPEEKNLDFKQLLNFFKQNGVGRPVANHGLAEGAWTNNLLLSAISEVDLVENDIDMRSLQNWFGNNSKGISPANLRMLAKVFGCGNPKYVQQCEIALTASLDTLNIKRKQEKAANKHAREEKNIVSHNRKFRISSSIESMLSGDNSFNLVVLLWAGCSFIGITSYVFGVHNITYNHVDELQKQVGFLWAPSWTILQLVILPSFLYNVGRMLNEWLNNRSKFFDNPKISARDWKRKSNRYELTYYIIMVICFLFVFLTQLLGTYLRPIYLESSHHLVIDWSLISIHRPEVISKNEASFLAFFSLAYAGLVCFLFLTGLVFIYTMVDDYKDVANRFINSHHITENIRSNILGEGSKLMLQTYRSCILGMLIANLIKLYTVYLNSTSENIVAWVVDDFLRTIRLDWYSSTWLDKSASGTFSSFLLLFVTVFVFLTASSKVKSSIYGLLSSSEYLNHTAWVGMHVVILLLTLNFFMVGTFAGFSILLSFCVVGSVIGLSNIPKYIRLSS